MGRTNKPAPSPDVWAILLASLEALNPIDGFLDALRDEAARRPDGVCSRMLAFSTRERSSFLRYTDRVTLSVVAMVTRGRLRSENDLAVAAEVLRAALAMVEELRTAPPRNGLRAIDGGRDHG